MKPRIYLIMLLAVSQTLFAQNPFAKFKVEHYDSKKGLPNDFIMNAYQSKEGFIWVNGYYGFSRFDGKSFVNFSSKNVPLIKADNSNSVFAESEDSTMWFPTGSSGLIGYKHGVFNAYMQGNPNLFFIGKTKEKELIISLGGYATKKYAIFNANTKKYYAISLEEMLKKRYYVLSHEDTLQRRWTGTEGQLFYLTDSGNLKLFGKEQGITRPIYPSTFLVDSKKRTWMGTDYGLYIWNGENMLLYPGMEKIVVVQPNPTLGLIAEDKDHGIWVSTGKGGLAYLPDGDTKFYQFPKQYLNIQTLHNISIDREGNIWLATDRGLFKISKTKLINYAEPEGIENNRVGAICQTGANSFLVTNVYNKVYELTNGVIKQRAVKYKQLLEVETGTCFYAYADKKNNQWLCCSGAIYEISGKEEKAFPVKGDVRYVCEGIDGKLYFGIAFKGIGFINDKGIFEYLKFPGFDFSQAYISTIKQFKDGTWLITTYRTGAYFISPNGKVENLDTFDNIKGIQIFSTYVDSVENAIWFATGKGLVKYANGKKWIIGVNANIPELSLFAILPDHNGKWWLPCNLGVMYVEKSQLDDFIKDPTKKIDWGLIDDGDGMNNKQCVGARHSIVATDGRLMVLGIGGLVEINPSSLNKNTTVPLVSVSEMKVDDSLFYQNGNSIVSPGNHRYIFNYSALSFSAPDKNKIKFKLVGYDTSWINSSGEQRAFYTNIPPGNYRFEVMASNNDGVWAKEPAVFVFQVAPFFYQTWWFKILFFIAIVAFVWLIVRWRTKAARERNLILEKEVAKQTTELRNSLENLKSTQKQLVQSEKMASLGELTAGIAHEIQNPLNFINNFSEVNKELLTEMKSEIENGNLTEVKSLADDIINNEDKINHHGKRADAIVKGMLQHSRTSSGQKEPTDINALCDEYLRLSYHGLRAKDKSFNAKFETDLDASIGKINIQPQEMGRVILNLINNAFYAVREKQKIEDRSENTGEKYQPTVTVSTKLLSGENNSSIRQSEKSITISIKDNGTGIPQKVLDKIFQPFFTTKPTGEGTGLGLSLSYDIITKGHSGELKVETKEGEGTIFTIKIPIQ